ncbi:hypothetical protein ACFOY8_15195 [Thalassospira xianhensis]|uniref:Uncharacterized protein n=1 Tax=Thalassospira xianhensis MCCC 1A02616 TaxID=1177929 RepID=A0A367UIP3_9PROT|nr:hypothetical protein [Thalassospira xianhensis]RCK07513.1 hypothetical protein TH5_00025 [Thalassospira xianhensis MCCC 1A02616]
MKTIDVRDYEAQSLYDGLRTFVVLGVDASILFFWGEGNKIPWRNLKPQLDFMLPGGFHCSIDNILLDSPEVVLNLQRGEDGDASLFVKELLDRDLILSTAPVTAHYGNGDMEYLGQAGTILRNAVNPEAAGMSFAA